MPCIQHNGIPAVIVIVVVVIIAVAVAVVKSRVGITNNILIRGAIARSRTNLIKPQAVDGNIRRLPCRPCRGLVPGGPFGNVGFDVGGIARAVARVDVAEGLGVGELVNGGEVGGPVAIAAVRDVVWIAIDVAVATVVT